MAGEPVKGQSLTEEDKFWLEQGKEFVKSSIPAIQDAGKQLITMLTTMQGIYLAAVAYSEFTKKLDTVPVWQHLVLALPLLIWLCALYFALNIFRSKGYEIHLNAPDEIQQTLDKIASFKQNNLNWTYYLIVLGFLVAVFNIVFYFAKIAK